MPKKDDDNVEGLELQSLTAEPATQKQGEYGVPVGEGPLPEGPAKPPAKPKESFLDQFGVGNTEDSKFNVYKELMKASSKKDPSIGDMIKYIMLLILAILKFIFDCILEVIKTPLRIGKALDEAMDELAEPYDQETLRGHDNIDPKEFESVEMARGMARDILGGQSWSDTWRNRGQPHVTQLMPGPSQTPAGQQFLSSVGGNPGRRPPGGGGGGGAVRMAQVYFNAGQMQQQAQQMLPQLPSSYQPAMNSAVTGSQAGLQQMGQAVAAPRSMAHITGASSEAFSQAFLNIEKKPEFKGMNMYSLFKLPENATDAQITARMEELGHEWRDNPRNLAVLERSQRFLLNRADRDKYNSARADMLKAQPTAQAQAQTQTQTRSQTRASAPTPAHTHPQVQSQTNPDLGARLPPDPTTLPSDAAPVAEPVLNAVQADQESAVLAYQPAAVSTNEAAPDVQQPVPAPDVTLQPNPVRDNSAAVASPEADPVVQAALNSDQATPFPESTAQSVSTAPVPTPPQPAAVSPQPATQIPADEVVVAQENAVDAPSPPLTQSVSDQRQTSQEILRVSGDIHAKVPAIGRPGRAPGEQGQDTQADMAAKAEAIRQKEAEADAQSQKENSSPSAQIK